MCGIVRGALAVAVNDSGGKGLPGSRLEKLTTLLHARLHISPWFCLSSGYQNVSEVVFDLVVQYKSNVGSSKRYSVFDTEVETSITEVATHLVSRQIRTCRYCVLWVFCCFLRLTPGKVQEDNLEDQQSPHFLMVK